MLKHTCERCLGTLAPEPPVALPGGALVPRTRTVCNRCGATRTEEQFMERVQEHFAGGEED